MILKAESSNCDQHTAEQLNETFKEKKKSTEDDGRQKKLKIFSAGYVRTYVASCIYSARPTTESR